MSAERVRRFHFCECDGWERWSGGCKRLSVFFRGVGDKGTLEYRKSSRDYVPLESPSFYVFYTSGFLILLMDIDNIPKQPRARLLLSSPTFEL